MVTVDVYQELERLREEARRCAAEAEQHRAEVSALLATARAILQHREFKDTARAIFDSCKELIGATAGYVALLSADGSTNDLVFLDSGGLPCSVDPTLPMPIRGLRAVAYRSNEVAWDNNFATSEWVNCLPDGHAKLDNVLFAPLVIEGKAVGLLGLANKPGGFTENDARVAAAFGELAAVALLNTRTLEFLKTSEERFRSVTETANDAIVSVDSTGRVVHWNPGAEQMFGYSAKEAEGRDVTFIMPERFHEPHKQAMQRVVSGGPTRIVGKTVELVGVRKGGDEFPVELSLATWKTNDGMFFTGIIRDITERKLAEEELRKSNQRIASILESITDAFFALDRDFRFTYLNQEAERLLRKPRERLLGRHIWEEFPEAVGTTFYREYERAVREQVSVTFEDYYAPFDTWYEVHAYPSPDGLSVYFQDISERQRARQELQEAYRREHHIADVLQRALISEISLDLPGYRLVASYRPALQEAEVGGDFYDVVDVGGGRYVVFVGDVSGKGLQAAVHTAMAKYMLRAYAHENPDPCYVLERLNEALCKYTPDELFITMFYGVLIPEARTLTYAVAGHDEPLLYDGSRGDVRTLPVTGGAVAMLPGAQFETRTLRLSPGDGLLVYTDGITEARSKGRFFGLDGISQVFAANATNDEHGLVQAIFEAASAAADGFLRDDAAILFIKARDS